MKSTTATTLVLGTLLLGTVPNAQSAHADDLEHTSPGDAAHRALELGFTYDNGLGVPVDRAKAADLYRQAADQGSMEGMFYLGQLYGRGDGVPLDKAEAYKWLKAAEEKSGGISDARQALEDSMSIDDIKEGQARLAAWKARY